MSTTGRTFRKKRDRARDRRQHSRLPLVRADELIVGDGTCGPRRSGFIVPGSENPVAEMARKLE